MSDRNWAAVVMIGGYLTGLYAVAAIACLALVVLNAKGAK